MTAAPINNLDGKTGHTQRLLAELTAAELDEQVEYFRERREWYLNHPDKVKPESHFRSNAYAAHRCGRWIAMAEAERKRRRNRSDE